MEGRKGQSAILRSKLRRTAASCGTPHASTVVVSDKGVPAAGQQLPVHIQSGGELVRMYTC